MALTGNKGEWSELYTLYKLLGEGCVYAGDVEMQRLDVCYPILNIIREACKRYEYKPQEADRTVIIYEEGKEFARFSMQRFLQESQTLFQQIKEGSSPAFSIPAAEQFMHEVGCQKLKAPSHDKSDIHLVIHDLRTGMTPLLGFSIKSQIGEAATLLNASLVTNILYKVEGLTERTVEEINQITSHKSRLKAVFERGENMVYADIDHKTFKNNLLFLDCCMPEFIARCLLFSNLHKLSSIQDVVNKIADENPFHFTGSDVRAFYAHKMKVLLLDTALGMKPATEWKGQYDANGGYLIVKNDGEIICYHFYNRNTLEDYLFLHTKFEQASRSRYDYGKLFLATNGEVFLRLNLQIRFSR